MENDPYTPWRALKFYYPLFLQAFSQSLTYPLVAAIATRGELGVSALTGFAQGQMVLFMIGAVGAGLPMTGMVFSRTKKGHAAFLRLNRTILAVLLAIGIVAGLPPVGPWIYHDLLKLPPELTRVAIMTLVWGAVMQAGFFMRNGPFVLLMNRRMSGAANLATFARVVVTAALTWPFLKLGWTGPGWALVAQTGPVWLEVALTAWFARGLAGELPETDPEHALVHMHSRFYDESKSVALRMLGQFKFTMPLSFGYFLLASSPILIAAFVGRTADAVMMLSIHYLTIGIFNPFGFGALRMQAVQIQFRPEWRGDNRLLGFSVGAGAVLGLMVAVTAIPPVARWYFEEIQNLPHEYLGRVIVVMLVYSVLPVVQCVRGRVEGLAAIAKRPELVMRGQIGFLVALTAVLSLQLAIGAPGWIMGVAALGVSMLTCAVVVRLGLGGTGRTR